MILFRSRADVQKKSSSPSPPPSSSPSSRWWWSRPGSWAEEAAIANCPPKPFLANKPYLSNHRHRPPHHHRHQQHYDLQSIKSVQEWLQLLCFFVCLIWNTWLLVLCKLCGLKGAIVFYSFVLCLDILSFFAFWYICNFVCVLLILCFDLCDWSLQKYPVFCLCALHIVDFEKFFKFLFAGVFWYVFSLQMYFVFVCVFWNIFFAKVFYICLCIFIVFVCVFW